MATPTLSPVRSFTPETVATEVASIEAAVKPAPTLESTLSKLSLEPATLPSAEVASIEASLAPEATSSEPAPTAVPTVALWQDKLSQSIIYLWKGYRRNRRDLGAALLQQKNDLEGQKYGQWKGFLEYAEIPRSSADRLILGYQKYLAIQTGIKIAAEAAKIDLCKPSVQTALDQAEVGFDEVSIPTAAVLKVLQDAMKPRRGAAHSTPLKGIERVKRDISEFLAKTEEAKRSGLAEELRKWLAANFAPAVAQPDNDPAADSSAVA